MSDIFLDASVLGIDRAIGKLRRLERFRPNPLMQTVASTVGPFFQELWDGIKQSFDEFLAWISSFGTRLNDALAGTAVGRLLGMETSKPGEGAGAAKPSGEFKFLPPMVAPNLAPGFFVRKPSDGLPHLELPRRKPLVRRPGVRPRAALDQSKAVLAQARRLASSQLPATAAAGAPLRGQQPPAGITINAQGPTVHVKQAPPSVSISVTVNVTQTNADPAAIGQATGKAVGAEVRKSMFDGVGAG